MHKKVLLKKLSLVVVAVLGAGLLLGMAAARAEVTYANLTLQFNPFGVPNPLGVPQTGQILNPGQVMCPGNTPTGNPMLPCPQGSRIVSRGTLLLIRTESDNPALTGWLTLEHNANFAPDYSGPVWGKFSIQLDAGGSWEGTWNGIRTKTGDSLWVVHLRIVGHGLGGNVDGMQVKGTGQITAITPMPIVLKGVGTARLLNPDGE